MAMIKRKRPKRKQRTFKKPKPKSPHVKLCEDLYNRLQADLDDDALDGLLTRLWVASGISNSPENFPGHFLFIEQLIARVSTSVATLQLNHPDNVSYRCCMSWENRSVKPKYGYLYPTVTVVKTSSRLLHSATLTYIELSKHAGKFP